MATSSLGPEAVASYRRMEQAFGELRAAHDLIRLNYSRSAYTGCNDPSVHGRELEHLVTRAEQASFEYRLAVREYVERMSTHSRVVRTARKARAPQLGGGTESTTTTASSGPSPVTAR